MGKLQQNLNAIVILILCGVLSSAFFVQFVKHEVPCPLCLLQRVGMIAVAAALTLNLFFGIRMSHYALAILAALGGGFVALRQISLHVCPGFSEFGVPVLGLSLYTWSFIVFVCCVLAISLIMFLYSPSRDGNPLPLSTLSKIAVGALIVITIVNAIATYFQCGLGPCHDI